MGVGFIGVEGDSVVVMGPGAGAEGAGVALEEEEEEELKRALSLARMGAIVRAELRAGWGSRACGVGHESLSRGS